MIAAATVAASQADVDLVANLHQTLSQLCAKERYDLVLIDSGPGDAELLEILIEIARFLLVSTMDDTANFDGVQLLVKRFMKAVRAGAGTELLGVLLFAMQVNATRRASEVRRIVSSRLEGLNAEIFDTFIRSDVGVKRDLRWFHILPSELVALSALEPKHRKEKLLELNTEGEEADARLWSGDPTGVARDYQQLAKEVMLRIAEAERREADIADTAG
jgi:cellulose biosynthesis protein BcsQ